MDSLTKRQRRVLFAVVDEFIATGEPVGSTTLAASDRFQVSSATIRNVLADLAEMGLLVQPHTSAGRMPTPRGTRRYVQFLRTRDELGNPFGDIFDRELAGEAETLSAVTRRAGELVSQLSRLTSIVSLTSLANVRLRDIKLSALEGRRVLVILVAEDGRVYNRMVHLDEPVEQGRLVKIQNYLGELVGGRTLAEMRQAVEDEHRQAEARYRQFVRAALEIGRKALERPPGPEVYVEGTLHMLEHRELVSDVDRLRQLLGTLEEKERVLSLVEKVCDGEGAQVLIGPELEWESGDDLSLIFCDYYRGDDLMGIVGVLGPMRMDYARVIPLVDHAARMLSRELDGERD